MIRAAGIVSVAILTVVGCGSPPHHHVDGGSLNCHEDPRVSPLEAGATRAVGERGRVVTLLMATPAEPVRGSNRWTVRIDDVNGAPVSDLALSVVPFMPDHAHGSSVKPVVTASGDGVYAVDTLDFFMPGVWRVNFDAPDPLQDPVDIFVCVEG